MLHAEHLGAGSLNRRTFEQEVAVLSRWAGASCSALEPLPARLPAMAGSARTAADSVLMTGTASLAASSLLACVLGLPESGVPGRSLRHPHLIGFRGACTAWPHICIVAELAPRGSLHDALHPAEQPSRPLPYLLVRRPPHLQPGQAVHRHVSLCPAHGARAPGPGPRMPPPGGARHALPVCQVLQLAEDISAAMVYLHQSVIHRSAAAESCCVLQDLWRCSCASGRSGT